MGMVRGLAMQPDRSAETPASGTHPDALSHCAQRDPIRLERYWYAVYMYWMNDTWARMHSVAVGIGCIRVESACLIRCVIGAIDTP